MFHAHVPQGSTRGGMNAMRGGLCDWARIMRACAHLCIKIRAVRELEMVEIVEIGPFGMKRVSETERKMRSSAQNRHHRQHESDTLLRWPTHIMQTHKICVSVLMFRHHLASCMNVPPATGRLSVAALRCCCCCCRQNGTMNVYDAPSARQRRSRLLHIKAK